MFLKKKKKKTLLKMGQKTNPNILQKGQTKKWNFLFTESKKPEFAKYSANQEEIQKFIKNFFNNYGFSVCKYDMFYSKQAMTFFISYNLIPNTLIKNKKTEQKLLQKINFNFLKKKEKIFIKKARLFLNKSKTLIVTKIIKIIRIRKYLRSFFKKNFKKQRLFKGKNKN